jgi:hypothetical protein
MEIILIPSLQYKLTDKAYRSHLDRISALKDKLGRMGKNTLKTLDVEGPYILAEMKVLRPPYRLYVIVNEASEKYYLVDWEHKQNQEKVIRGLKGKLELSIKFGVEKVFI